MSYKNRKAEYERLMEEVAGSRKKDKYHKIPQSLRDEFGDPEAPAEETEAPAEEEEPEEETE